MKDIKSLLDVVDQVRDDVALGLMSDPGLSKTSQVKQWAEENGREYCELIISQRMPSEISGMPMPIAESKTMEVFDYDTLLHLKDGDVLAFDEFTNGNIQTLNACLTLIQERVMLSGKKLPSLVIVAMGNPQGRCDLLPQTKQRFWWVTVSWDPNTWADYMRKTWGFTPNKNVIAKITTQYREGFNNKEFNYFTPRTMENLYRVARSVDATHPFWLKSEISPSLVTALYEDLGRKSSFHQVKDKLLQFCATELATIAVDPESRLAGFDDYNDIIIPGINSCESAADLRQLVANWEQNNVGAELIAFMKETEK